MDSQTIKIEKIIPRSYILNRVQREGVEDIQRRRLQARKLEMNVIDLTGGNLKSLIREIRRENKVTDSLKLQFERRNNEDINDTQISMLCQCIQSFPLLKNLTLDFSDCNKITKDGVLNLGKHLSNIKSLHSLSLRFTRCKKITDDGNISLIDQFKILKNLRHLSLNFFGCEEITDEGVIDLSHILKSLTMLKRLALDFSSCSKIEDNGIISLSNSLKSLNLLQSLFLGFSE